MNAATEREETVFYAALKVAEGVERATFLEQACAGDAELRASVEGLLAAQGEVERFFAEGGAALNTIAGDATAAADVSRATAGLPCDEEIGARVGRYKLLQRLGEGGCGVVYMAEQQEPVRRRVAFKIIKLGMDTKSVIARFEVERQALALMDHPNIARVLDAGATDTGRPYFVMELVRGTRITDYCDQNHLETRQRLDLFIQVCHAIQHAHQKGIIHRDIKPSNILVTLHDGVPVPKVIDFGIAKATEGPLTDKTLFTAYEQFIGTPAYMSPEQAELSGLDIDTRSDIYSLGVLLYELLTGKTPFDPKKLIQSGLDEMRRTLREREPQRPSTMVTTLQRAELALTAERRHAEPPKLIMMLKGDLDWIVMKALEKDRVRRYQTANGLAMDVQRYLSNEPVIARPPSRLYKFGKLVQRNRVLFAAAGMVAAALLAGLCVSSWLLVREREARRRAVAAEQEQARLREAAEIARATEAALRRQAEARERITHATVLVSEERLDEADKLIADVAPGEPSLECAAVLRSVGAWHAVRGEWNLAAQRLLAQLDVNQNDVWDVSTLDFLAAGAALAEAGRGPDYERFRQKAIARFSGSSNPVSAERIVKICLLLPPDEKRVRSLAPLAATAIKPFSGLIDNTEDESFRAAWRAISMALLEYRRGNAPQALDWCRQCLAYSDYNAPRIATAHVIRAMASYQLHQVAEAHTGLAQGREVIDSKFKGGLDQGNAAQGFWFDWVFARVLLREATDLIEPRPLPVSPN
jgi:serine/threonine protein kinase